MAGGKGEATVEGAAPKHGGVDAKAYENREVVESFTAIRQALEEEGDLFGSDKV